MKCIWVFIVKFRLIYCFCIHVRLPLIWVKYRQYHVNLSIIAISWRRSPRAARRRRASFLRPSHTSLRRCGQAAALFSRSSPISTRASPACSRPISPPLWAHARVRESLAIGCWSLQELILSCSVDACCHASYSTWLLVCVVYANADLKLLVMQQRAPFFKVPERHGVRSRGGGRGGLPPQILEESF